MSKFALYSDNQLPVGFIYPAEIKNFSLSGEYPQIYPWWFFDAHSKAGELAYSIRLHDGRNLIPFAKVDDGRGDIACFDGDDVSGDPRVLMLVLDESGRSYSFVNFSHWKNTVLEDTTSQFLIAADFLPVGELLLAELANKIPSVCLRDWGEDVRQAYARSVALLDIELRGILGVVHLTDCVAFYNAYYWSLIFTQRYQTRYGSDSGIEQEAIKRLAQAPKEVDWQVVESIRQVAQRKYK